MCTDLGIASHYVLISISVQTFVLNTIKTVSTKIDQIELLINKKHGHDQNTEAERYAVFKTEKNEVKKGNIIHQSYTISRKQGWQGQI